MFASPPPRRIAIAAHPDIPDAIQESVAVERFLCQRGVDQLLCTSLKDPSLHSHLAAGEYDLLIALGGDGSLLRAGRLCAPLGLPVLGINLGRFGFLSEVQRDAWPASLERLLDGDYWLERRMMLHAAHWRRDERLSEWDVVNEVVVCRGQSVRPIRLQAFVDGYPLTTYVADGLIAATPTGSTAYALAAGGPILPPGLRNILIIAVAPHLSMDRAIVLAEGACVTIAVHSDHQAVFSVDGQPAQTMQNGDEVRVAAAENTISFVRFQDPGYFYRNLTAYMEQNPSAGMHT